MTLTSPTPTAPVKLAPTPKNGGPSRPSRFRMGAGQQLKGGPFAYAALAVVGFGSLLPLYWTLVAASRTQDEVLAST
ncbi:carbohydrate ABC transporter permease, partial [Streptomyces sp. SID7982]|nr:carbohydrate ABC transporter permease [Streptomyces sp. SID7982]